MSVYTVLRSCWRGKMRRQKKRNDILVNVKAAKYKTSVSHVNYEIRQKRCATMRTTLTRTMRYTWTASMFQMSFPKPSAAMKNSRMPIGRAVTNAAMAKKSSSANSLPVMRTRTLTANRAAPPETPVTIGVMWVRSRTGCSHIVSVIFCAASPISKLPEREV
jgi:hypothetical protein